ncbi:Bug family tripartite tricarboxylate transporter substrate binding protein [Roseomonas sp. GCM10028921]
MKRREMVLGLPALGAGLGLGRAALAQEAWPVARPIEIIVPYPPGGGIDIIARLATKLLPQHLPGANLLVTNRPGAGGQSGNEAIFAGRPDGWTIGAVGSLSFTSIPLERPVRWRTEEFTFLANMVDDPSAFWVRVDSPLRNLSDLRAAMARRSEAVSVGSAAGIGSDDHQLLLAFEEATGTRALHSPYNGTAQAIRDLLGGQIDVASYNMSEGLSLMQEGRTRCLGQAAERRWSAAAEVPTFREQGLDVTVGSARGFVGPPGLPPAIADRLIEAFGTMMASPAFIEEAARLNLPLRPLIGAAYGQFVQAEAAAIKALFERRPWGGR